MKSQSIKAILNLVQAYPANSCDSCICRQISGMQCPVNEKDELLCDRGKVWQFTPWAESTSLKVKIEVTK